jgi:hypothetical protein
MRLQVPYIKVDLLSAVTMPIVWTMVVPKDNTAVNNSEGMPKKLFIIQKCIMVVTSTATW